MEEQNKNISEAKETVDEIAKSCNQLLDNLPCEGYKDSQILLIRHGYSKYNYSMDLYNGDIHLEEGRQLRVKMSDIDSPLHDIGVEQAKNCCKYLNDLDVHTVFISPLLRTLQTTELLFQSHPEREKIKFIVLPELAEGLCFSCSFAPLAFSEERRKQFSDFDFSRGDAFQHPTTWQIEQIQCQNTVENALAKFKGVHDEQTLSQLYLDELDRLFPKYIETHDHLWTRSQQAKNIIEEYKQTLPPGKKIIVIAHYVLLLFLTSSQRLQSFHDMDGVRCKNSKITPWTI